MKNRENSQDAAYFSLYNLNKLSGIDDHLSFVNGLITKYHQSSAPDVSSSHSKTEESNQDWDNIQQQINLIQKKKNDKKLNISVIGEFSTGKSTFINALLRRELLASSALQGTTVASTVIDYSDRYEIHLQYLDGRPDEKISYGYFHDLKEGLGNFTTNPPVARLLKAVNVYLPSDILKNNFRIIDTPGTNVTEAWHEEVTVRTLKEVSDLSIVLISAEKPVSDTMLGFVRQNLESILPQCVFVVTKLDTIRQRERKRLLSFVKMKLEEELEIKDAVVLPYVSPMVLCNKMSGNEDEPETKKKICIIGGVYSGKRSLAEAILEDKLPDRLKGMGFSAPVLKLSYGCKLTGNKSCYPDMDEMTDVIMLMNAVAMLSSYERSFIQQYIVPNCQEKAIIAVSKMDMIGKQDVPQIKEFSRKVLDELIPGARICYISPYSEEYGISSLIKELEKRSEKDSDHSEIAMDETLLKLSFETEQKLIQHTTKQRTLAITKKLTVLTDDMYKSISMQMEKISKDYESKLDLLNRSRKTDLTEFVQEEKRCRLQHFDEVMRGYFDGIEQKVHAQAENAGTNVIGNLDDKNSIDQLSTYIKDSLSGDCSRQAMNLISGTDGYYKRIQKQFKKEMNTFRRSFKEIYQSLKIIPLDMSRSKYDLPQEVEIETANITSSANYIAEQLSSENKAYLGGAAAGAAIGTAIFPGIGTIAGMFCGALAGAFIAPDTDKVRGECKEKLRPQLTNYYNSISDRVIAAVDNYIGQIRSCLSDEIDEYLKRYRREVERQIAIENGQRSAINAKINDLSTDRKRIKNRKAQLDSVMVQLYNLGRKEQ